MSQPDPYAFDPLPYRQRLMFEFGLHQSIRDPNAHMKVAGVTNGPASPLSRIGGIQVRESDLVSDHIYVIDGRTVVIPRYSRYGERWGIELIKPKPPFWTRHTLGVREAARAVRRRRKGLR